MLHDFERKSSVNECVSYRVVSCRGRRREELKQKICVTSFTADGYVDIVVRCGVAGGDCYSAGIRT